MDSYPQTDYPWTLYFNGCEMPRYANCWGECGLQELFHESCHHRWPKSNPDMVAEMIRLEEVYFGIDHVGSLESADPLLFRRISLRLLYVLLDSRERVLKNLSGEFPNLGPAETVYTGVCEGLFQMDKLAAEQGAAFWSAGYKADQENLLNAMRRSTLSANDPDYFQPPHLRRQQMNDAITINFLRTDIIKLLGALPLSKELRGQIHGIPHGLL